LFRREHLKKVAQLPKGFAAMADGGLQIADLGERLPEWRIEKIGS